MCVEPRENTEASIAASLQAQDLPSFWCEACRQHGGYSQRTLGELPSFLVVLVNKTPGTENGIPSEPVARLPGEDFHRFTVVNHEGMTADSGHYTATVRQGDMAYQCDDPLVTAQPHLCDAAWPNAYMIFLARSKSVVVKEQ